MDVGTRETEFAIRLYQTAGEHAPYIALSHCWGTQREYITNIATLEERLSGLDWNSLPKSFQDVVYLARKLNIQYVWIDSLCIVQDDKYVHPLGFLIDISGES